MDYRNVKLNVFVGSISNATRVRIDRTPLSSKKTTIIFNVLYPDSERLPALSAAVHADCP